MKTLEELKKIYVELSGGDDTVNWFVPQNPFNPFSTLGIMVGVDWEGELIILDLEHPDGACVQVASFGDYDTLYQEEIEEIN